MEEKELCFPESNFKVQEGAYYLGLAALVFQVVESVPGREHHTGRLGR